jgi:hypothetical protein
MLELIGAIPALALLNPCSMKRKLSLKKETIRQLNSVQLVQVGGAGGCPHPQTIDPTCTGNSGGAKVSCTRL